MMRKIESSEEIERREKRRNRILTGFMLGILVFSTLGFAFFYNSSGTQNSGQKNDINSNGKPIVEQNGDRWSVRFGDQVLIFSTSPEIAKNISANFSSTLSDFQSSPLYLFIKNDGIKAEVGSTLGLYTQRVQEACYGKCKENLPEKNCTNNFIIWKESEENRVYQEEKCIFIEGDIRAADAFLYRVFGII
ncbi:hypothetical protein HYW75_03495 [Candidatus Pacearchaeota archaeon]|nr:hypothetical protein [Candidatus Pacearchaeota archaeon]